LLNYEIEKGSAHIAYTAVTPETQKQSLDGVHQEHACRRRRMLGHKSREFNQKAMRKRSMWVEPLFGEAKEFHGLRRFLLRRLLKVNIEGVMVAAGQDLKRLIKRRLAVLFYFLAKADARRTVFSSPLALFQQAGIVCVHPQMIYFAYQLIEEG
jgi:hypothetical protein